MFCTYFCCYLSIFFFTFNFKFSRLLLLNRNLKYKAPSSGFKLAKGLSTAASGDSASPPARPPRTLSAPTPPPWRVPADLPARGRALRCGALGRASRLRPAHAARLHFYGERTIAEVWRVAVCRRDNPGFLFIATLSTCRRVGLLGPRRAWGSRGCPARGGRATCRSCAPGCASPAGAPLCM